MNNFVFAFSETEKLFKMCRLHNWKRGRSLGSINDYLKSIDGTHKRTFRDDEA